MARWTSPGPLMMRLSLQVAPWKGTRSGSAPASGSQGSVDGLSMTPLSHRAEGTFRERLRSVEIDYRDGTPLSVRVAPPPQDDGERDIVPDEMRVGTSDPMSAILAMIRVVNDGAPCSGRQQVFDGRRRYDLVFTQRGTTNLAANSYGIFAGAALQCEFEYVPLRGHERRNPDPTIQNRQLRTGRAFLAAVPTGMARTPVRVDIDGDWANMIVHLRQMVRVAQAPSAGTTVLAAPPR